ncbi:MAG: sensor histidine kinase, partial [Bryobacteraceae bacterium]
FQIPVLPPSRESKEFADVQVKLNLLGQQYRGARQNANELRSNVQQLLERLEEGVLLFDPAGRLMMAGRPLGRLLGRVPDEMIGQTLDELFPATSGLGMVILDALHTQESIKDRIVTVDRGVGGAARLVVSVVPVSQYASGKRAGTLVTLRDAESRRQLEMQLDVSGRLAAISRLTSGVAHEIKNPLNAIALHLEVLRTKLEAPQPEIEVIAREIARLDRVVRTFLDFTRPITLRMQDMDFAAMVREIADLVRLDAEKKNVHVQLEAPAEPCFMRGDADLLKQSILNVVVNGIEAMKTGGALHMRLEHLGNELALAISDEGPGIQPDLREKIFNLYYSTKEKGSGIGLAITFRVVQLHNGTIELISELGKGTTFF